MCRIVNVLSYIFPIILIHKGAHEPAEKWYYFHVKLSELGTKVAILREETHQAQYKHKLTFQSAYDAVLEGILKSACG